MFISVVYLNVKLSTTMMILKRLPLKVINLRYTLSSDEDLFNDTRARLQQESRRFLIDSNLERDNNVKNNSIAFASLY